MGDRYGGEDINEISIGISIWDMGYRYEMVIRYLPYRYGISVWSSWISIWDMANNIGDDSIDKVISHIDMRYLVTLTLPRL